MTDDLSAPADAATDADDQVVPDDDAPTSDPTSAPASDPTSGRRGPIAWLRAMWQADRSVVLATGFVAIGFLVIVQGVLAGVTGDDRSPLPDLVEEVRPVPDASQVLPQSAVFVDLAEGYTGVLIIDGVRIETIDIGELESSSVEPGQQVEVPPVTIFEPGNDTLTFVPTTGAVIEQFDQGRHRVELVYWAVTDGPGRARSFSWVFDSV